MSGASASRLPVLILGSTSGIGRALAIELAAAGTPLVLAARSKEEVSAQAADLRLRYNVAAEGLCFEGLNFAAHSTFFAECLARSPGGLEGVVLCFGYLADQQQAQKDFAIARRTLDVNLTAAVSILELAADYFEERRRGFICALSSVAGDRGRQGNYIYCAAKAGLTVYLQGLRNRLARAGVQVTTVKPGFVDTRMTFGKAGLFLVATPEQAARGIVKAIRKKKDCAYVPGFWRWIMLMVRAIPECVFKRLRV